MATDRTPLIASRQSKTNGGYVNTSSTSTLNDDLHGDAGPHKQEEEPQFNIPGITQRDFVLILTGLWSATFLGSLDSTIVATLLTDIGTSFEKSNMASWLGTSYLLSVCCFTPIYGRLCDIIGRRGAMMTALTFFGIGTIGCGFAPSMGTLILARAVAGAGGGAMMSVGSIIVTDLIPLRKRGLYQGLANCCFGLGAGLGGPLGGFMSDRYGWRSAFLIQIPVLFISFFLVWRFVHIPLADSKQTLRQKIGRVDFLGSATLVTTVSCLLVSLTLKTSADQELPWSDLRVWGLLVASAVFGVCFVLVEKYVANEPIMPLRLLTQRTPAFVACSNLLISVLAFSVLYNVPLWFSAVKRVSSSEAGSHLVPNSIALALGSVAAGAWMRHTGKYYWLTISMAASALLSMSIIATFSTHTPSWLLWVAIVPSGFGMSGVITSTLIALIACVRKEDIAVATGVSYMFRTTGQVLGVSLSAALTQSVLTKKLTEGIKGHHASEIINKIRHATGYIDQLSPENKAVAIDAYTSALKVVFICQIVLAGLTLLSVAGIPEAELPDRAKPEPAPIAGEEA